MLLDSIRALFGAKPEGAAPATPAPPAPSPDPLHLAACALLLEVAHADGEFSAAERAHLEAVLARHFGLAPGAGHTLLELAERERRDAVDHHRFTSLLREGYDVGQKMVLAEIMWGLVLADGDIAEHESYLTRRISNLLDLAPGYLSEAKKAAMKA